MDRQVERHQGTGLWSISDPTRDAVLATKNLRNPSISARQIKVATNFPHENIYLFWNLQKLLSEYNMLWWQTC